MLPCFSDQCCESLGVAAGEEASARRILLFVNAEIAEERRLPKHARIFDHCTPALKERRLNDREAAADDFDLKATRNEAEQHHLRTNSGTVHLLEQPLCVFRLAEIDECASADDHWANAANSKNFECLENSRVVFV